MGKHRKQCHPKQLLLYIKLYFIAYIKKFVIDKLCSYVINKFFLQIL
jgi:hypothetical protein